MDAGSKGQLAKMALWVMGILGTGGTLFVVAAEPSGEPDRSAKTLRQQAAPPAIPHGPLGDVIRLGEEIVAQTSTHPLTASYVGNKLDCTSCHLENGRDIKAATFIGVASAYPAWSPREKRVITLEDRVLNCFMRSCDGKRLPVGSKASVAITAYITWLSQDHSLAMNGKGPHGPNAIPSIALDPAQANATRGKSLYTAKCASCHADDGQGDEENPPVWGPKSYNRGAGLSHNDKLAAWLRVAMPLGDPDLTEQEALDIAAYVNSYPRRDFHLKDHLPEPHELGEYNGNTEQETP